mgnify:CR=1 FL=1
MTMKTGKKTLIALSLCAALFFCRSAYCEFTNFKGEVSSDGINLRSDSTISSDIICKADKGVCLEVIAEKYGWYKIKLPQYAPSFIRSDLLYIIDINTARVNKSKANIRLRPAEDSPILGQIDKDTVVTVVSENNGWYRIEPAGNSFGWINKQFVKTPCANTQSEMAKPAENNPSVKISAKDEKSGPKENKDAFIVKGVIQPYGRIFNRVATHKLTAENNMVYLLKGDKGILNPLTYHNVKITGKIFVLPKQKFPIIEIEKIEALD